MDKNNNTKIKLLIVDDEVAICNSFKRCLESTFDFEVIDIACSGGDCFDLLKKNRYAVLLMDICLPDINGIEVMKQVQKTRPDLQTIVITAHGDLNSAIEAIRSGAVNSLPKPVSLKQLQLVIKQCIERIDLKRKLKNSEERFRDVATSSSDWIWEVDKDLKINYFNGAAELLTRIKRSEIIG